MKKIDNITAVAIVLQRQYSSYNPYYSHLVDFAMLEFRRLNIQADLIFVDQTTKIMDFKKRSLDGLLLIDQITENQLECIRKTNIPFVWLDAPTFDEPCDHIHADNFTSAYRMAELVASMGHKKILFLGNKNIHVSFYDRYKGIITYIEEHPNLNLDLMELDFYHSKVVFDTEELLELLKQPERPTAIIAVNDDTARLAANALRKWEIRIPQDISLVGFDNIRETNDFDTLLTTVHISVIGLATEAVNTLINRIRNPKGERCLHTIKTDIVKRKSLGVRPNVVMSDISRL